MANIVPKLNLNKTPSVVENNSMVFAKNARIDCDGSIHKDYGIMPMTFMTPYTNQNTVSLIKRINHENIFARIIYDMQYFSDNDGVDYVDSDVITWAKNKLTNLTNNLYLTDTEGNKVWNTSQCKIVGIVPDSNDFYLFIYGYYVTGTESNPIYNKESLIIRYEEERKKFYPINCNWNYSGGTITGNVINNLVGNKILNIGEYLNDTKLIPLKCIDLSKCNRNDDESIYTQSPKVPIINLNVIGNFSFVIPNGVYQFFIRYKISDNNYTNWFPASKECFATNKYTEHTNYGTLQYCEIDTDASESFIFSVENINDDYKGFESFQIGFILSHDDSQYARAWKHFDINKTTNIKFDYKASDSEEIEITDFLKPNYQLYNVGNITSFKNKLYISNYTETDFNDNSLSSYASNIKIDVQTVPAQTGYGEYLIDETTIGNKVYIKGLKGSDLNNNDNFVLFRGENGIIYKLLSENNSYGKNIITQINNAITGNPDRTTLPDCVLNKYDLRSSCNGDSITVAENEIREIYSGYQNAKFDFSDEITDIYCNNRSFDDIDSVINYIINNIYFLNSNAEFVDSGGNNAESYEIKIIRPCNISYTTTNPDIEITEDNTIPEGTGNDNGDDPEDHGVGTGVTQTVELESVYTQTITIKFIAWKNKLDSTIIGTINKFQTLVPYQKYKFYIHYINKKGEITNGYLCNNATENGDVVIAPYQEHCTSALYPVFKNIVIPNNYIGCFFSIVHYAVMAATVINPSVYEGNNNIECTCIELDTKLIPNVKDIICKQDIEDDIIVNQEINEVEEASTFSTNTTDNILRTISYNGTYYNSSDASIIRYFGANGVLVIDENENIDINKNIYIVTDYESSELSNDNLIKCTPFINSKNLKHNNTYNYDYYDDYTNMNLRGYICEVNPLNRNQSIKFYNDGSTIYNKTDSGFLNNDNSVASGTIQLKELTSEPSNDSLSLIDMGSPTTEAYNVYSNWNLNCLGLSEKPNTVIKTYKSSSSTDATTVQIWFSLVRSLTMSAIYELPSMYKEYVSKNYSSYRSNEKTRFDNTIRSSELSGDEEKISVFKFNANDYYNVPCNRGIITNLIAVGNAILVHTKDSLFKFSGSNNIQSTDGEIQTTENNVFDTGVSEIFGSQFGFAGLKYKKDCIITENGYIFLDRDAAVIYMYSGNNQLIKLTDSIEKLFRRDTITNISFANDFYNNRFFVCINFKGNNPVTLSYNFNENVKSFVSLHDFWFVNSFSTKTNCYFINNNNQNISTINKTYKGWYHGLDINTDYIFPTSKHSDYITAGSFNADIYSLTSNTKIIKGYTYDTIVDIICNSVYDTIKTLNYIEWCSRFVSSEFPVISESDITTLKMADVIEEKFACGKIMIYTDTCCTEVIDFDNKISNNYSISNLNSYKKPRYNQGKWNLNYFRDIQNATDLSNYLNTYDDGRNGAQFRSDNNSLIEGKYFVVRFFFDKEFKLETLDFNYKSKI